MLPSYGNTHSESSWTGRRTTQLREEARQLVRDVIGADSETVVLFCGSGATAAVDKLVGLLGLREPDGLDHRGVARSSAVPAALRPVERALFERLDWFEPPVREV